MGSSTGKKGGKKIGRDKVKCAQYRALGTREKNKERRKKKEAKKQIRRNKVREIDKGFDEDPGGPIRIRDFDEDPDGGA